jgi:ABC-type transport system involved in multi-copper enzyme maturation permease subunit
MFLNPMPVLAIPEFVHQHLHWFAFGAIVLIGLILFGMRDLLRFSWTRVWAISGVCFDESIRRRVLWITPLAILGVIVVSQLQKPFDEQDAIRQTIKFCLFATALIVAITTVILACTNLPREIDTRVIYTVVTKPTTRLEIVLGKVVGFARVSAVILIIMGIFTTAYLRVRAWSMERYIGERLKIEAIPPGMKATLAHYKDEGLLTARTLATPEQLQVMARLPDASGKRWMVGEGEGDMLIPFALPPNVLGAPGNPDAPPGASGVLIAARIGYEQDAQLPKNPPKPNADRIPTSAPTTGASAAAEPYPYMVPFIVPPEERATAAALERPGVTFNVLSPALTSLGQAKAIVGGMLTDSANVELSDPAGQQMLLALIPPQVAGEMSKYDRIFIQVTSGSPKTRFFIDQQPMVLQVPGPTREQMTSIPPQKDPEADQTLVLFRGRQGTHGSQLRGDENLSKAPVAVYSFRHADIGNPASDEASGGVPFEFRTGIERSGDYDESSDAPTNVQVIVRNTTTGEESEKIQITPESGRPTFFKVPSKLLAGGDFDVQIQNNTQGHYAGLGPTSLSLIRERQMFEVNLFKSLLILWLMSVLVTAVAIFTSTFLSWPIAVVLTLVILLGHWGVEQISDSLGSEMGSQVATDLFGAGAGQAAKAKVVSSGVNALSAGLKAFANVLPDISRYAATEDIERGVTIPAVKLREAAAVTFGFGIPLVVLAYVLLRNKEVAP